MSHHRELVRQYAPPRLRPLFNRQARLDAGFQRDRAGLARGRIAHDLTRWRPEAAPAGRVRPAAHHRRGGVVERRRGGGGSLRGQVPAWPDSQRRRSASAGRLISRQDSQPIAQHTPLASR